MKYIIMSDGNGTRWNNYLGITKQEIIIDNERLIDRTVRMISERTTDNIYILSSNPNHCNIQAKRIVSKYIDYFHKKYAYDFLDMPTTYLYGDTFYDDKTMNIIINDKCDNITFYGNEYAIVAVKVNNYELLKQTIDKACNNEHSLYHLFDKMSEYRSFVNVGYGFTNINKPNDYINLNKLKKITLKK